MEKTFEDYLDEIVVIASTSEQGKTALFSALTQMLSKLSSNTMEKWKELKVDNRELELIIYALQESLDNNPVVSPRAETELSTLISKLQDLKAQ